MPEIRIRGAGGQLTRIPLDKECLTIGRARGSDVVLSDLALSRRHAEIRSRPEGYFLKDLGSVNGTRLNGERIRAERRLYPGDLIRIADHVLAFCDENDPLTEPPEDPRLRAYEARDLAADRTPEALSGQAIERRTQMFETLSRAAGALVAHRPLDELVGLVLDELLGATPAARAALVLMEGEPLRPVVKASRVKSGPPIGAVSRAIARRVVGERVSVLVPAVGDDPAFRSRESLAGAGIRSAMAAPLWLSGGVDDEGDVIGLVYLDSFLDQPAFDEDDLRLLTTFANLAAARIHSARLLETAEHRVFLHADLERAAQIQASLLPREPPCLEGYSLASEIRSGSVVSADYYDFAFDRAGLTLALGDVAGKGTGAAILMTLLRAAVRAHWADGLPGQVMARINRNLRDSIPPNRYATLFLGHLEPGSGRLLYVNAGHHAPIVVRAGGAMDRLREGGTVLGVFDDAAYLEGTAVLGPGDVLAVFSDGVAEAQDEGGAPFQGGRLASLLAEHRGEGAGEIMRRVLAGLAEHVGGDPVADDWTLIILKRLPPPSASA
jgi:serine phosphatase RsbU (regulator of sigma subunit)